MAEAEGVACEPPHQSVYPSIVKSAVRFFGVNGIKDGFSRTRMARRAGTTDATHWLQPRYWAVASRSRPRPGLSGACQPFHLPSRPTMRQLSSRCDGDHIASARAHRVITITTTAKFTFAVNFPLTGSAHHRSRSEGTLRRFLSPLTHHHHDATVRQHQAHDPHQSLTR